MNAVIVVWSMAAGACLMLGAMHSFLWLKCRPAGARLALALAAFAVAGIAAGELSMMLADGAPRFVSVFRWTHLPLLMLVVAIFYFVRSFFQSDSAWLGWAAVGFRFLAFVLDFSVPESANFRGISPVRQVEFLGETVTIAGTGTANPWSRAGELSSLLLLAFVIDASIRHWRKGSRDHRRRAMVAGGSIVIVILLAAGHTALIHHGMVESPYLISFAFVAFLVAMGGELSYDVILAARAAEKLKDSQQQVTLAAGAARLLLWRWDLPKNVFWVTPEGCPMHGIAPEEDIDLRKFLATVHADDRESVRRAFDESLAAGGVFAAEYRVALADGAVRWMSARGKVEFNRGTDPVRICGVSMDITERRQAEEHTRLVVEAAPNAILMADASGKIVLVNKQTEITFGYLRDELLGQSVELLVPERFSAGHRALREGYLDGPVAIPFGAGREVVGRRKDGTDVPVEIGLTPIVVSEGTFVLASIIDISGRLESERTMAEQRNQLTHLSRVALLGQLSGSLAHELNQPLGIILSNAQAAQRMVAADDPDIPELREILADIISEDRRAGEVIRRLRSLLKREETLMLPLALDELTEDVLRLLRSDLIGRGVTVRTAFDRGLPAVPGDRVQLQQVMLNMIINACDSMVENPLPERILRIFTSQQNGTVRISVQDQGCGLPGSDATRVFQPFFTTKTHGMGLGLSISQSIVRAHQGQLWAEPNAGRGATFHMELQFLDPVA